MGTGRRFAKRANLPANPKYESPGDMVDRLLKAKEVENERLLSLHQTLAGFQPSKESVMRLVHALFQDPDVFKEPPNGRNISTGKQEALDGVPDVVMDARIESMQKDMDSTVGRAVYERHKVLAMGYMSWFVAIRRQELNESALFDIIMKSDLPNRVEPVANTGAKE